MEEVVRLPPLVVRSWPFGEERVWAYRLKKGTVTIKPRARPLVEVPWGSKLIVCQFPKGHPFAGTAGIGKDTYQAYKIMWAHILARFGEDAWVIVRNMEDKKG